MDKDYLVYGTFRRTSAPNFWRLEEIGVKDHPRLKLVEADLLDLGAVIHLIQETQPDEIYNLAAQSFVGESFSHPTKTYEINSVGALNLLECIRLSNKKIKFYQASTSEMFGNVSASPQDEGTAFHPRSPYGVSKLYAHWMTVNYRDNYNIFATSGILFNHESPLRGLDFVTRKITHSVAQIKAGKITSFELGNLDARRDWGFAKDYIEGMWKMLQVDAPDTFVLATGKSETVRTFLAMAFECAEIDIEFEGRHENELVIDKKTGAILVKVNPNFYRPGEVHSLIGNPQKAKKILGWEPRLKLAELCRLMVTSDIQKTPRK